MICRRSGVRKGGEKLIEFEELLIEKLEDYDKLYEHVGAEAIDDKVVETLKDFLGIHCKKNCSGIPVSR